MLSLRDYAAKNGVTYQTAWNRARAGKIRGAVKDEFGRIWVPAARPAPARLSTAAGKNRR